MEELLHIVIGCAQEMVEQAIPLQHVEFVGYGRENRFFRLVARTVIVALVLIHDFIRLRDQHFQMEGRLVGPSVADGNMVLVLLDDAAQVADLAQKIAFTDILKDRDKFIAACAVYRLGVQRAMDEIVAMADQLVARIVPKRVVGLFQGGDVAIDHADRTGMEQAVDMFQHGVPVESAGQQVVEAQHIQFVQQVTPSQQGNDKVTDDFQQWADQCQCFRVGVIHSKEADDLIFNRNRARDQP